MGSYDPVIGRSDDFIEWFELEVEYEDFDIYCRELARKAAKSRRAKRLLHLRSL